MFRLHPASAHTPLVPRDDHSTARNPHPIAPELDDRAANPPSNDLYPYAEGAHHQLDDIPTQLALGSDGRLYITAEELPESIRRGRRVFAGVALTAEEAAFAVKTLEGVSAEVGQTVWRMIVNRNASQ